MSEYKLVPFPPTPEMVKAARDSYMRFGYMELAIRAAMLAAPAVQGEPVAMSNDKMRAEFEKWAVVEGLTLHGKDGRYLMEIQSAWMAWQASRAALVVEQQPSPAVACSQSRESAMVVLEQGPDGTPTVWCDPEIADLVSALNKAGIRTVASCSGHGHRPGNIMLSDGRELAIARDFDEARKIDAMFPGINGEPPAVQGEPVGRVKTIGGYPDESEHTVEWLCKCKDLRHGDLLYAAPQPAEQQPEVLAEGYFHPLPDESDYEFHDAEQFPDGSNCPACVPAVIVRKSAVTNQPAPDVARLVDALVACAKANSAAEVGLIVDDALTAHHKHGGEP